MTLAQLDEALTAWQGRLSTIADNLLELQTDPTYRTLTGSPGTRPPLTGATAARVTPALGAMHTIFEHFGLLSETVERARKIRRSLPSLFGAEGKLREAEQLLFGPSIRMPAIDVPLEQRTLLGAVRNVPCLSLGQLLDPMARSFEAARDAVLAVGRAWEELAGRLGRTEAEMQSLAAQPLFAEAAELRFAAAALAAARGLTQTDPLGALREIESRVEPQLSGLWQRLRAAEAQQGEFRAAQVALGELESLARQLGEAAEEARSRVLGCPALPDPSPDAALTALRNWLLRLSHTRTAAHAEAIAVGLRQWRSAAEGTAGMLRAAILAQRAPVEQRRELRGRLDAMRAKARAYGVAEVPGLTETAREAEVLLGTAPTDLEKLGHAVAAYEQLLARQGRKRMRPQ